MSGSRASARISRIRMPRLSVCDAGAACRRPSRRPRRSRLCRARAIVYDLFSSRTSCSNIERADSTTQDLDTAVRGGHPMQFHHHGYVSGDPRVLPAAGTGLDRPDELPDEIDVLIVGIRARGHRLLAAQLSQYPVGHDAHHRAPRRPARDRPGRRHPGRAASRRSRPSDSPSASSPRRTASAT